MADAPSTEPPSLPAAYQAWRASELGRITDRIEEQLIVKLVGAVQGKRVLDVGLLSVLLARAGADMTGLDADPHMVAAARDRATKASAAVTFVEEDARQLPFADDTFDVVVAITVLCLVADAERAVSEMARVLQPGGRLVIGELGRHSLWAAKRRFSGWLGSKTWRAALFRSPRELKGLATTAGLDVEEVRGAIYYPPCNLCARWLAPLDARVAAVTTFGAAFITLAARKLQDHSQRPS
jgi:SAM-dependent methyltransferase